MNIRITQMNLQNAAEALTVLGAFAQEGRAGSDLLTQWLEGMSRDLRQYLSQGTSVIKVGAKEYRVSKQVAAIISQVGLLADKWGRDFGGDYLPASVDTLNQWLVLLKQHETVRLSVILSNQGLIEVSVSGYSKYREYIPVVSIESHHFGNLHQ
jgi:hypothetical protein